MTWAFILDHYNYWIVIILMMAGLYVVLDRGNLVKKLVGLNVFQTSVFLLYISMGKILGGTAPIEVGGHGEDHSTDHAQDLSGDHSESHGTEHADTAHATAAAPDAPGTVEPAADDATSVPDVVAGSDPASSDSPHVVRVPDADPAAAAPAADGAHTAAADTVHAAADQVGPVHDVIYSNPLPHVLILTAIVVGVATLAVGLAIIVRIRESYGTIEEDEIVAADNAAEFGEAARRL